MKTKGRRQSKNVEVQTDKQSKAALKGLELQDMAYNNTTLKEKTPMREQGLSEEGRMFAEVTNPANVQSRMASNKRTAGRAIKSGAERQGLKDPKPGKFNKNSDFKFFTHKQKGK